MSVCNYHRITFGGGVAVDRNKFKTNRDGIKTPVLFDTTPHHAIPDPRNRELFALGRLRPQKEFS